jgi:hypothetical protein
MSEGVAVSSVSRDERLRELFEAAARGSFPVPEWRLELVSPPARVLGAVIAFTGHHVVAADVDGEEVKHHLDDDDIAAPFNPSFLAWLGERLGARVGHVDVTLARLGTGLPDGWVQPVAEPPDNERVRRARGQRVDVEFLAPPGGDGVVTLGRGLAGRRELSMEIGSEADRNMGAGRRLVLAAVSRVPSDEAVFASVAPGNARSLRCLLGAGFAPIGAECILTPTRY